jgi:hypothetical protein
MHEYKPWGPRLMGAAITFTRNGSLNEDGAGARPVCFLYALLVMSVATGMAPTSPWRFVPGAPFLALAVCWTERDLAWSDVSVIRSGLFYIGGPRLVRVLAFQTRSGELVRSQVRPEHVHDVGELHGVADEEHAEVVADEVPVAVLGVELDREPARVAGGLGGVPPADDGREPHGHVGRPALLLEELARV